MLRSNPIHRKGRWGIALALGLTLTLGLLGGGEAQAVSSQISNPIVDIVKKASPAVVNIDVETLPKRSRSRSPFPFDDDPIFRHFFGDAFRDFNKSVPMKGRGSGFIVTKDGQIFTNNHVIDGVDKITVTLSNGETYPAKVLGKDALDDLAIIKIEPKGDLPVLDLGDSDEVEVGEWVVAIGNPVGLSHSVTAGIISAKNRSIHTGEVNFDNFLQTDAAINPGNSGGPLLNMDGKVVGINTAIIPYAQGIGFAVPVNVARGVRDSLVADGRVRRGWLGISLQGMTPDIAKAYGVTEDGGVIVSDVFSGSAAERGGVKRGDVVMELNGEKVKDSNWFVQKVRTLAPGTTIRLGVVREGKRTTLKIKLDERPESVDGRVRRGAPQPDKEEVDRNSDLLEKAGIDVAVLTSGLRRQYRLDSNAEGLVVVGVKEDSPAGAAGVREGDLLHQVNGQSVKTFADLSRAMKREAQSIVLMIERDSQTFILSVNTGK